MAMVIATATAKAATENTAVTENTESTAPIRRKTESAVKQVQIMNENNEKNFIGIDLGILLGDFFRIAKRLLLVLVALVIVFSGLLCFQTYRSYYPMYRADATFTVYVANPLQTKIQSYNTATAEQMAKTFPYILTSSALKDTVKRELGVTALPSITASVHSNTNIFTLTVTSGDPQLAYDVLNAVIEHYPSVS